MERRQKDQKYPAFLSYDHDDREWGDWLHKALENYRIPARLRRDEPGRALPERLFPVFRDREEFGSSANLTAAIHHAIDQSENLIVICSPRAAKSEWVDKEIRHFQSLGRGHKIHCLIVDGEIDAASRGLPEGRECIPAALREKTPLAADVRPGSGSKREALLKIVAGVLGVTLGDLTRRDVERRRRIRLMWGAAAIAVLAAVIGLAASARSQRLRAEREAFENRQQQVSSVVESGWQELSRLDPQTALLRFAQSLRLEETSAASRWFDETDLHDHRVRIALLLWLYPTFRDLMQIDELSTVAFEPGGARFATFGKRARVWRAVGEVSLELEAPNGRVNDAWFTEDGRLFAIASNPDFKFHMSDRWHYLHGWDRNGHKLWEPLELGTHIERVTPAPGGRHVAFLDGKQEPLVVSLDNGQKLAPFASDEKREAPTGALAFSAAGRRFATADQPPSGGFGEPAPPVTVRVWDLERGVLERPPFQAPGSATALAFSPDGTRLIVSGRWVYDFAANRWLNEGGVTEILLASPDGRRLVRSSKTALSIQELRTGAPPPTPLETTGTFAQPAEFSPDGSLLLGSDAGELRLWDVTSGRRMDFPHWGGFPEFSLSTSLITPSASMSEMFYGTDSRTRELAIPPISVSGNLDAFDINAGERWLTLVGADAVSRWSLAHMQSLMTQLPANHSDGTKILANPAGDLVAVLGSWIDRAADPFRSRDFLKIVVIDSRDEEIVAERDFEWVAEQFLTHERVAWAPEGRLLLIGTARGPMVWDPQADDLDPLRSLDDDHPLPRVPGRAGNATAHAFGSGGRRMTVHETEDGWARGLSSPYEVWEVVAQTDGPPAARLQSSFGSRPLAVSRDGTEWVYCSATEPTRRDLRWSDGSKVSPTDSAPCQQALFSPDGSRLAVDSDGELRVWDVESRDEIQLIERLDIPQVLPMPIRFNADGTNLLVRGFDEYRIWDLASGRALPARQHPSVDRVQFSDDGRWVAAWNWPMGNSLASNLEIRHARRGDLVLKVSSAPASITDVALIDGGLLLLLSDGRLMKYRLAPDLRSSEVLLALAELISWRTLDEGGEPIPLPWKRALKNAEVVRRSLEPSPAR